MTSMASVKNMQSLVAKCRYALIRGWRAHICFQECSPDLPHGYFDVVRCELAIFSDSVPHSLQPLAEVVEHASSYDQA